VIVFDVSTLVGVAIREDSIPDRALCHALRTDRVALLEPMLVEFLDVMHRPSLTRFLNSDLLTLPLEFGVHFRRRFVWPITGMPTTTLLRTRAISVHGTDKRSQMLWIIQLAIRHE